MRSISCFKWYWAGSVFPCPSYCIMIDKRIFSCWITWLNITPPWHIALGIYGDSRIVVIPNIFVCLFLCLLPCCLICLFKMGIRVCFSLRLTFLLCSISCYSFFSHPVFLFQLHRLFLFDLWYLLRLRSNVSL